MKDENWKSWFAAVVCVYDNDSTLGLKKKNTTFIVLHKPGITKPSTTLCELESSGLLHRWAQRS